jgi:Zn-dependent peptidase ImmA (M78 family)
MRGENDTLAVPKAKVSSFERGFKTWCENKALSIRAELNLKPSAPLSPFVLAQHLGVIILDFHKVQELDTESATYLTSAKGDEWSAVTVYAAGKKIIVTNPRHSEARQASNIMHELAHIIRGHRFAQVRHFQGYAIREFDQIHENEANWLAGCLLLPRKALLDASYTEMPIDEAVEKYGVSKSLYKYRVVITGVNRQRKYGNH